MSAQRLTQSRAVALNQPVRRLPRLGPTGVTAAVVLAGLILAALFGPAIWSADPNQTDLLAKHAPFSRTNPLGTDEFGRDLLARLLHGARRSLLGATTIVVGCTLLGMTVGVLAGVSRGFVDATLGRLIDALLALPSLVVALGVVGVLGASFRNLLLALILTGWPWYARLYRSFVLKERREVYVLAARATGCGWWRIVVRHIGPNIIGTAAVLSTVNFGSAILNLAALSFLGLGVQPPTAEWGAMINGARIHFQSHPWLIFAPGLAISLTVLAINVLGDALRDAADPRMRGR